jgi:para-aminobenzoate synthetase component 1
MARDVPPKYTKTIPLVEELPSTVDLWDCCRRLAQLPHVLLLESVQGPAHLCRYSFLTGDPFRWILSRRGQVEILDRARPGMSRIILEESDPFAVLARQLAQFSVPTMAGLPPFQGGAAGLFGYDLCHHLERLPRPEFDEFAVPDMAIGLYDWVLARDHEQQRVWLVATGLPGVTEQERLERARARVEGIRQQLGWNSVTPGGAGQPCVPRQSLGTRGSERGSASGYPSPPAPLPQGERGEKLLSRSRPLPGVPGLFSNFDRETYLETVRRAVEYIHAGDCFQVNIAQRLLYPAQISALELYGRLRQRNPAPFAGYFDLGEFHLASSSPERFVRLAGDLVETRPIKGTRPRGGSPEEDQRNLNELLHSQKDRAENVMIVDLLRNDLGRVCRYGTVRVTQVCQPEAYRYVHHLVSEVRGQLRPGLGAVDLLRATFPGGSVTGAPKIRAMEIITELERTARGAYCGSLGYIGFDGSMDTNILIRTFTIGRGWVQFPVGGGIVADSVPELEYEETWHKAQGSVQALQ